MFTTNQLLACQLAIGIVLTLGQLISSARHDGGLILRYLKQRERISHAELINELNNGKEYSKDEVEHLLAKTRSKNTPNAILNTCSVNDLLLIGDHRLFRCTESYIGKSSELCEKLSSNKFLHSFCRSSVKELQDYCLLNHEGVLEALLRSNLFSSAMFDKVKAFWGLVYRSMFGEESIEQPFREHIRGVLNKQSEASRTNIFLSCRALTRILSKDPVIRERDSKYELFRSPGFWAFEFKWANLYQYCRQANELRSEFTKLPHLVTSGGAKS